MDSKQLPTPASLGFVVDGASGLSEREARERMNRDGANELPSQKSRGMLRIALEVAREPMFLLLLAAGGLYLATGKRTDAVMLLGFVFVVMAITIIQGRKTERALDALRDLSSPRALVMRDGQPRRIPGREVVRGDVLIVAEGDRIPADALLRRGTNLRVDESLLTGESVPVHKIPSQEATALERPGGDAQPSLFSGTLVTGGQGLCEVLSTGLHTELGRIGKALQAIAPDATPLQIETGRMVRTLAIAGLVACSIVVVIYAMTRGETLQVWKEGLLAGIAMAMAILPEEFSVVLTVFLALGAWRISKNRVLTRRMAAIETLGAATVLCVDKTGTLTENRMTLTRVVAGEHTVLVTGGADPWPEDCRAVLDAAILASRADPFDPMERALHIAAARLPSGKPTPHAPQLLVREYPLAPALLVVTQVWQQSPTAPLLAASKGRRKPSPICAACRPKSAAFLRMTSRAWRRSACVCSASRVQNCQHRTCCRSSGERSRNLIRSQVAFSADLVSFAELQMVPDAGPDDNVFGGHRVFVVGRARFLAAGGPDFFRAFRLGPGF